MIIYMLIMGIAAAMSSAAAWYVKSTFDEYKSTKPKSGKSGKDAAKAILKKWKIKNVKIEATGGTLTDHYAPTEKKLRLSEAVHDKKSLSALAVAAHEAGHADQDKTNYSALLLRTFISRPAMWGSRGGMMLMMAGGIMYGGSSMFNMGGLNIGKYLIWAGVIMFSVFVFFQLITLPVEFNASSRAKRALLEMKLITKAEYPAVSKILWAAALTYVASAAGTLLQLLFFLHKLGIFGGGDKRA